MRIGFIYSGYWGIDSNSLYNYALSVFAHGQGKGSHMTNTWSNYLADFHKGKFIGNWAHWRMVRSIDANPNAARTFQINHARRTMRYRAFLYAEARNWRIDWTE